MFSLQTTFKGEKFQISELVLFAVQTIKSIFRFPSSFPFPVWEHFVQETELKTPFKNGVEIVLFSAEKL